jgi:hypothetical protein
MINANADQYFSMEFGYHKNASFGTLTAPTRILFNASQKH